MRAIILAIASTLTLGGCGYFLFEPAGPSAAIVTPQAPTDWQRATFGALADLAGKGYRGEGINPDGSTFTDHQVWEWALSGHVLRCTHALGDGSYGGETLIYPDAQGGLAYVYVTIAGFRTEGTMSLAPDGGWVAMEAVTGHPTITRVRSTGRIEPDASLTSTAEFEQDGAFVPGHSFTYRQIDPPFLPALTPPSGDR